MSLALVICQVKKFLSAACPQGTRAEAPFCVTMTVDIAFHSRALIRTHVRSRRHFAKLPQQNSRVPLKDKVVRLRSRQQPSALTVRRLLECNQPCTDRNFNVALEQRKELNVVVKPLCIWQSRRQSLGTMQQIHAAICLISTRESSLARP